MLHVALYSCFCYVQVYTVGVNLWYIISQNYLTSCAYFWAGNTDSALNSPRMVQEKDAQRSRPPLRGHSLGLPAPSPSTEALPRAIWASHGLWVLAASQIFLLEWKNTCGEEAAAGAPTRRRWQTDVCRPEPDYYC